MSKYHIIKTVGSSMDYATEYNPVRVDIWLTYLCGQGVGIENAHEFKPEHYQGVCLTCERMAKKGVMAHT